MNGYTIPPHAKQYIESKGKDVNRYTYTTSHQTIHGFKGKRHEWIYYPSSYQQRNRIKEDKGGG